MIRIPLFPLNTVLFPGGPLQLRVFEPRYLEMISDCLRHDGEFGVCLIQSGEEIGPAAVPHAVGTVAGIVDWEQRRDGLLGITIMGRRRFRLQHQATRPSQLLVGEVELLTEAERTPLPERFAPLRGLLQRIIEQLEGPYAGLEPAYDDAAWVGYRLAEILPLPLTAKQNLLELDSPIERLEAVERLINRTSAA